MPDVVKPHSPRVPAVLTRPTGPPEPDRAYQGVHVAGGSIAGYDVQHIEVVGARLEGLIAATADLSHAVVRDCVIERGDFANVMARRSTWTRVTIEGARMTGAQVIDSALSDVGFQTVKMDMAAFRFTKMRRVTFVECQLMRADFTSADLRGATFIECDLSGAQFSQAKADGARFEKCWLEGIGGVGSLRGASVRSDDLVALYRVLARELGIDIVG